MKKYLVIARAFNEPDNNTPSSEVWVKVSEFKDKYQANQAESIITDDWLTDYQDVDVEIIPLDELDEEWRNISETY